MLIPNLISNPITEVIDLPNLRTFCDIDIDDETKDSYLNSLSLAAYGVLDGINGELKRCVLESEWEQSFYEWSENLRLWFPDVKSVRLQYLNSSDVWTDVSSDRVYHYNDTGSSFIFVSGNKPDLSDQRVKVRAFYVAGMVNQIDDIPDPIKLAIKAMVRNWFFMPEITPNKNERPYFISNIISQYRVKF